MTGGVVRAFRGILGCRNAVPWRASLPAPSLIRKQRQNRNQSEDRTSRWFSFRPREERGSVLVPDSEIEGAVIRERQRLVELTCSGQRAAQQSFDELSVLLEYGGGPSWSL